MFRFKNFNLKMINEDKQIPESVIKHIYYKVNRLIQAHIFREDAREDLIQELIWTVVVKMKEYKQQTPSSNGARFFYSAIKYKILDICRYQNRRIRDRDKIRISVDRDTEANHDFCQNMCALAWNFLVANRSSKKYAMSSARCPKTIECSAGF